MFSATRSTRVALVLISAALALLASGCVERIAVETTITRSGKLVRDIALTAPADRMAGVLATAREALGPKLEYRVDPQGADAVLHCSTHRCLIHRGASLSLTPTQSTQATLQVKRRWFPPVAEYEFHETIDITAQLKGSEAKYLAEVPVRYSIRMPGRIVTDRTGAKQTDQSDWPVLKTSAAIWEQKATDRVEFAAVSRDVWALAALLELLGVAVIIRLLWPLFRAIARAAQRRRERKRQARAEAEARLAEESAATADLAPGDEEQSLDVETTWSSADEDDGSEPGEVVDAEVVDAAIEDAVEPEAADADVVAAPADGEASVEETETTPDAESEGPSESEQVWPAPPGDGDEDVSSEDESDEDVTEDAGDGEEESEPVKRRGLFGRFRRR